MCVEDNFMAIFQGDAQQLLDRARTEQDLRRKCQLLEDALGMTLEELRMVLVSLGRENFSARGLKEVKEE